MDDRLIDREREREELSGFLAEALSGRGALLLLAGEAGVGKTTLARAAMDEIGLEPLEGFGIQDGTAPYGPIVQVLRHLDWDGEALRGRTLRARLAPLLPELGARRAAANGGDLLEAVGAALAAAAAVRPVAVFLDDLQWADGATLDALPSLARAVDRAPVALVGAYRSDDVTRVHPIRRTRTELRRAGLLRQLAIEPFDAASAARLLERTIGARVSAALSTAVFDRTDGVPFFVEELGSALSAGGLLVDGASGRELIEGADLPVPDTVRDAVLLRAAGLSADARSALLAASVAGHEFDVELVSAVAEVSDWSEEALRSGLVVDAPAERMAFRHALVREAFAAEVPRRRLAAMHRSVAEHLEAAGGSDRAPDVVVAEHWAHAKEFDRARRAYLHGAEASARVHAYRDAATAARRALDLWPDGADPGARLDALERLGEFAELSGDLGEAVAAWRDVAEARRDEADPERLGRVRRRLAAALELQGRWEEGLAWREAAAAAFDEAGSPAEAVEERVAAAAHLRSAARFRPALALLERALQDARRCGRIDQECRVLGHEGNVRARMGDGVAGVERVRLGLSMALQHNLIGPAAEIYQRLADSLEHAGDYAAARETYDEAFGFCETNAAASTAQLCLACLTVVLRQLGDWDRAATLCRDVIASDDAASHARAVATGTLGFVLGARGQLRRARPLLVESSSLARGIELAAMELLSEWGLALVDDLGGNADAAAGRCRAVLRRWRQTEERHYVIGPLRWAVTFLAESGDADGMRACVTALAQIATDSPLPDAMSALSHALGETALADGDPDQAAVQFAQALDLLRPVGPSFERMQTERRAAAALLSAERTQEAVSRLVSAHRIARRLGARPFSQRLAERLSGLGEAAERRLSPRAVAQLRQGGLTRRELDVVRLVAVGRTNREIGQELFLSPRTVEMHVQNILAKLDCRSRADASRRASELGLLRVG
ncbi:MAG TPA: AAA family ATPase [Actinomycetota bacterium]